MTAKSKPGTIGALVNGAVKAGLVKDRKLFTAALVMNQNLAVAALCQAAASKGAAIRAATADAKPTPTPYTSTAPTIQSAPAQQRYPQSWEGSVQAGVSTSGFAVAGHLEERRAAASVTPNTEYPASFLSGTGLINRVLARVGGVPKERQIHDGASTTATADLLAAQQAAEVAAQQQAQASSTGYSDRHDSVAAAGGNAVRLAEAERADLDRMTRERAARS